jgi:hypothetical protein
MSPGFINKTEMYGGDHPGWLAFEKVTKLPIAVLSGWDRGVFNPIAHRQPKCIISYESLADEAGCGRSTTINSVAFLEGMGFVIKDLRVGYAWANRFRINWELVDAILTLTLSDADLNRNDLVPKRKRPEKAIARAIVGSTCPTPTRPPDGPTGAADTPARPGDTPEQAPTITPKQSQYKEALRKKIIDKSEILREICGVGPKDRIALGYYRANRRTA